MVAPLRRVLMRRPGASFGSAEPALWHYSSRPQLDLARRQHDQLVEKIESFGAEVVLTEQTDDLADSIFVHDPVLITDRGSVALSMGKDLRRGEVQALMADLEAAGVPRLATLSARAHAECGDLVWLDDRLLAVGQGFRTDRQGFDELSEVMAQLGVATLAVELPLAGGADACLHLQSLISLISPSLAVVYPRYLPIWFHRLLLDRGFDLVEVPDEEEATLGANVLALAPNVCVALEGNPVTRRGLERRGVEVQLVDGSELCWKAEGGPTCLTRPILRAPLD